MDEKEKNVNCVRPRSEKESPVEKERRQGVIR